MEIILGIFIAMGGALLALLRINKNLRSKNKLKDLEVAEGKLEVEQAHIKKQKEALKKELANPKVKKEELSDQEIEQFWKGRKGDK
jgi:hypothetical protein